MATGSAMEDHSWLDNDDSIPSPAPSEARKVLWRVLLRRSPTISRRLWACCGCSAAVAAAVFVAAVTAAIVRGSTAPSGHGRASRESRDLLSALEGTRCKSTACQRYAREFSDSLDWKRQPCEDLYGFVCGRWPHEGGSVHLRAAFDAKAQALASALSSREDGSQVGALVRACLRRDLHDNGLQLLQQFLGERGLPWPRTLTRPLLEVLLDLSANWNLHLWFRVDATAGENQRPTVQFRQSPELVQWIDERQMRQGTDYELWMARAFELFGKPSHSSNASMILLIKAMDNLITHLMGAAVQQWQPPAVTTVGNLSLYAPLGAAESWLDVLDRSLVLPQGSDLSREDTVQLFDRDVLQTSLYLIGLDSETETHLALSVGLRVVEALGWMVETSLEAPHGVADGWRTPRCLSQVQYLVGPAWHDLLLMPHHDGGIVEAVRSVLRRAKPARVVPSGVIHLKRNVSEAVPSVDTNTSFFSTWLELSEARAMERRDPDAPLLLEPHSWLFPFYHEDLPLAVNFAGLGGQATRRLLDHDSFFLFPDTWQDRETLIVALSAMRLLGGADAEAERLFFAASCHTQCTSLEGAPGLRRRAVRFCNEAAMRLAAFRDAFRCSRRFPAATLARRETAATSLATNA